MSTTQYPMPPKGTILIAGGSGLVGRKVAEELSPDYPGQVIIAGRDVDKAAQVAAEIGHGVQARRIDVHDPHSVEAAIEGVDIVLSCVIQPETPHLLLASVAHGCGYTDIAPLAIKRPPYSNMLKATAVASGARIILGAGLLPGISNILARMGAECVGSVDSVLSTCLLSLGDEYGSQSKDFIAKEITTPFKTTIGGQPVFVKPFTRPVNVTFAQPVGVLAAYRFPFSDQVDYPVSMGAHTATSYLALLPQWVPMVLATILPLAGGLLAARRSGSKGRMGGLMDWLKRKSKGLDWWGVHVEVRGERGMYTASVQGHRQAQATACSAAAILRALLECEVERPGIWTADQIVPVEPFLKRLATHGFVPTTSETKGKMNGTSDKEKPHVHARNYLNE